MADSFPIHTRDTSRRPYHYQGRGADRPAPAVCPIIARLERAGSDRRLRLAPGGRTRRAVGGIGSALLTKAACPVCWTFAAGLASSAGLGVVQLSSGARRMVDVLFLLSALVVLAWGAWRRRGYGPLGLGAAATTTLWSSEYVVASEEIAPAGAALLIAASVWNAGPRRTTTAPVVLRRARVSKISDAPEVSH